MLISIKKQVASSTKPAMKKIKNYVYNINQPLGAGNFSKVYRAFSQETREYVSIKIVELQLMRSQNIQQLLQQEIKILSLVNHPNILRFFEAFADNEKCYIVTQLCNGGDLDLVLKHSGCLIEERAKPLIKSIFEGLFYLSEKNIIHRDLKVANIFIHNGVPKIADFGFATIKKQKFLDLNIGSPFYMSPQGFINCVYGPKTDVWAFGVLIYQLLHGASPFALCHTQQALNYQLSIPFSKNRIKPQLSTQIKEIILKCIEINESKRISFQQLRKLPYFNNTQSLNFLKVAQTNNSISYEKSNATAVSEHSIDGRIDNFSTKYLNPIQVVNRERALSLNRKRGYENQRNKSHDHSQQQQKKYHIFNSIFSFKASINVLHYCRLGYRFLTVVRESKYQNESQLKQTAQWIIYILQQLNHKLNHQEIIFDEDNRVEKQQRFREVRNQYERKYIIDLKKYLDNNNFKSVKLNDMQIFFYNMYLRFDSLILNYLENILFELGHYCILLYDVTRILNQCAEANNFTRFMNYKQIENMLNLDKNLLNYDSYLSYKKRVIFNN